ncbi:MAG TPA: winged helix-turn-helix domain-containing protein [Vicinamibacterales bacterium]
MEAPGSERRFLRFGSFELDVRARELRNGSTRVRLQEQPFEILRLMLERPGDVVTREELRQHLWPSGTFVDFEHSLNAAIKRLRATLGDDADCPRFVETVPRRGYRFIAGAVESDLSRAGTRSSHEPRLRLAVLPFSNLSDDSSQEYFSDGLTEELIAQLGPLCRGQVGIIARWSSMFFKGSLQRAREIGEALHAEYLLEGSTRRDGSRVRITVRLIETASEAELWSETFDRNVSDWLTVQADVASRVARSLMRELVIDGVRQVEVPQDRSAYQAYLKGQYYWAKPGDEGLQRALECMTDAVRLAPKFAAAHGMLARLLVASAEYYHDVPCRALTVARETANRALEIDPTVSDAHAVLADVRRTYDADWTGAEAGYAQALALNASNESALRSLALTLALQSRPAEALKCAERARDLDPLCLAMGTALAWTRYLCRDYEGAMVECRQVLEVDPELLGARRVLAASLLQAGRREEAAKELETALTYADSHPVVLAWMAHVKAVMGNREAAVIFIARARALESSVYVPPFHLALAYTGLGDIDAAFAALDQAWTDRDPALSSLDADPRFRPLKSDSRFGSLLSRLNVPRSTVEI